MDEKYLDGLNEHYKGNQAFIDKAIFTLSSAAIPALITFAEKLNFSNLFVSVFYIISVVLFILVIIFQIIACKIAKEGCDRGMEVIDDEDEIELKKKEEKRDSESCKLFQMADFLDNCTIIFFIIAIVLTFSTVCINISETYKSQQACNPQTITINASEINLTIRKDKTMAEQKGQPSKGVKGSGTPPKYVRPNPNPPKDNKK